MTLALGWAGLGWAGLVAAYCTSLRGLKDRARLEVGKTLLVLGAAGGVGIAAVEIGRAMGARVIAAASTDEKLVLCRELGADEIVNYATKICANASTRSQVVEVSTWSLIRSGEPTLSRRCELQAGEDGWWSSSSPQGTSPKYLPISVC
jgi:Zn-dependent alcohol dehydrogenase